MYMNMWHGKEDATSGVAKEWCERARETDGRESARVLVQVGAMFVVMASGSSQASFRLSCVGANLGGHVLATPIRHRLFVPRRGAVLFCVGARPFQTQRRLRRYFHGCRACALVPRLLNQHARSLGQAKPDVAPLFLFF